MSGQVRSERVGRERQLALRAALLAAALALALALALQVAAPAQADDHLLHAFGTSFGGEGVCKMANPSAVAVDEADGEVFVYDRGKNQVDGFSLAGGACLHHFKVSAATKGEAENEGIAFDNSGSASAGRLYVVSPDEHAVRKFKINGATIEAVGGAIQGESGSEAPIHGIALDAEGDLFIYQATEVFRFDAKEPNVLQSTITLDLGNCEARRGFAVSGDASALYVGTERENVLEECEEGALVMRKLAASGEPVEREGGTVGGRLDNAVSSGAAVDRGSGEVYINEKSQVAAFDHAAGFVQRFGEQFLSKGQGIAVDSQAEDVIVVGLPEARVFVFVAQPPAPPPPPPEADHVLPDGRGYELVTPLSKLGSTVFGIGIGLTSDQASEDGEAITYGSSGPVVRSPPSVRGPEATVNLARRGAAGWSTDDILTPRKQPPIGFAAGKNEYRYFTPDLSTALIEPGLGTPLEHEQPLAPEATETTVYSRDLTKRSAECEPVPSSCYRALVHPGNETSHVPFGAEVHALFGTPNGEFFVFQGNVPLSAGLPEEDFFGGLYEWSAATGAFTLVSQFPAAHEGVERNENSPGQNRLGGFLSGTIQRHAISEDGRRVFWSTGIGGRALYLRDTALGVTLRLDKQQGPKKPEEPGSNFWDASADGSRVFFTDTRRLLPHATAEEENPGETGFGDLYSCEIVLEAGAPACKLSDLTESVRGANEIANVQGVIGASTDGTTVYFVADGALEPQAGSGNCIEGAFEERECTLYVAHFDSSPGQERWQTPTAIAVLRDDEVSDWLGSRGLSETTSRVSPNGRYLAFMSSRSLTGYDTEDASHPGVHDVEVYVYDSATNKLACPSCNPSGASPVAVFDPPGGTVTKEGTGLLVDPVGAWGKHWLAGSIPGWTSTSSDFSNYQSRYLSDTGRLFFNSPDQLVPADKNHKEDVYEYELDHEGSCDSETGCVSLISLGAESDERETAFIDAGVGGRDVFFLTSQPLIAADKDPSFDIYDARVCGGSDPCRNPAVEERTACESEASCRAAAGSVPALPPVTPTQTAAGSGNKGKTTDERPKQLTPRQRLQKALAACRRLKTKRPRHRCEAKARAQYHKELTAIGRHARARRHR